MIFIIEYIIIIIIIYSNMIVNANDRTMGGSWYGDTAAEAAFKGKNSLRSKARKLERRDLNLEIARINGSNCFP